MKYVLISFALVSANAIACPDGASSKDAMAPAMSKPAAAAKATPITLSTTTRATTPAKAAEKVAAKAPDQRKTAPL